MIPKLLVFVLAVFAFLLGFQQELRKIRKRRK